VCHDHDECGGYGRHQVRAGSSFWVQGHCVELRIGCLDGLGSCSLDSNGVPIGEFETVERMDSCRSGGIYIHAATAMSVEF
jgi:hypothetical protein